MCGSAGEPGQRLTRHYTQQHNDKQKGMFIVDSTLKFPEPLPRGAARQEGKYLYCTAAEPGSGSVSPLLLPLIEMTFWSGWRSGHAPRQSLRYREVVNAAERLIKPHYPGAEPYELRKAARWYLRDVLALADSPIVRTYAELEASRHA